jgi:hypothetical protein
MAMVLEIDTAFGPEQNLVQRTRAVAHGRDASEVARQPCDLSEKTCGCLKEIRETSTINDSSVREIVAAFERKETRRPHAS